MRNIGVRNPFHLSESFKINASPTREDIHIYNTQTSYLLLNKCVCTGLQNAQNRSKSNIALTRNGCSI